MNAVTDHHVSPCLTNQSQAVLFWEICSRNGAPQDHIVVSASQPHFLLRVNIVACWPGIFKIDG